MRPRAAQDGRRRTSHRIARATLMALSVALITGCTNWFLAPEPGDDPVALFDQVWSEYDAYYSFFVYKGIDWDSVYDVYRPRIGPEMTPWQLAVEIGDMIVGLEDGHAELYTPFERFSYTGWYDGYPENWVPEAIDPYIYRFPPSQDSTHGHRSAPGLSYGWRTDRIGYVRIPSFGTSVVRDGIDIALDALAGADALIIDIRHNGGGSDLNSDAVVGRFLERRLLAQYHAYRNGPGHDDFTDRIEDYVEPRGSAPFTGPLAVLTNRRVFSTAEAFVLAMRALPHRRFVVTVGDTTGGGLGNPLWRELPNGWSFRVPRWQVWSAAGVQYEGVGIPPDYPVTIGPGDEVLLKDPILTTAEQVLQGAIGP